MAIQLIPYALQNAAHPAAVFRQAASAPYSSGGIITVGDLAVTAQSTPNMSVQIAAGRAMVTGTSVSPPSGASFTTQGMYNVLNDGPATATIAASDATNPRIDAVYVQVQDSYYVGSMNQVIFGVALGTPAASPVAPAVPVNALLLGYVAVGANATTIVAANITINAAVAQIVGVPFATAAGSAATGVIANATGANVNITFPVGRFTQPPMVEAVADSSRLTIAVNTITTAGATISAGNWSPSTAGAATVRWVAVQMTSASAAG